MDLQRLRIQAALREAGNVPFFAVRYANGIPSASGETVYPASVLVNETGGSFAVDSNNGRTYSQYRTSWTFELHLKFDREVSLEKFERSLMDNPIVLPKGSFPRVFVLLARAQVQHPRQQETSQGTEALYIFNVEEK